MNNYFNRYPFAFPSKKKMKRKERRKKSLKDWSHSSTAALRVHVWRFQRERLWLLWLLLFALSLGCCLSHYRTWLCGCNYTRMALGNRCSQAGGTITRRENSNWCFPTLIFTQLSGQFIFLRIISANNWTGVCPINEETYVCPGFRLKQNTAAFFSLTCA